MKTFKTIACLSLSALLLTACAQQGPGGQRQGINKSDVGTLLGAGVGAALGSNVGKGSGRTAAIAVGTLLGAGLGREVGASMDRADMMYYRQTSQKALETVSSGQSLPWKNPESGHHGTVTPMNYYQTASGQYCREYQQSITVGGQSHEGYGVACRQPDGSWEIKQ